jgi:hypothetical protein
MKEKGLTATPTFVRVQPSAVALTDNCSFEVSQVIAINGGNRVYGWKIWLWPGIFYEAIPHCVWRSATGELLDVTPNTDGELSILFVDDPSNIFEDAPLPSVRKAISPLPEVLDFLRISDQFAARFVELSQRLRPGTLIDDDLFYQLQDRKQAAEVVMINTLARHGLL